jgi:hypothetical protein
MKRFVWVTASVSILSFLPSIALAFGNDSAKCLCHAGPPCECKADCDCHPPATDPISSQR